MREAKVGLIALAIFLSLVLATHDSARSMVLGLVIGNINVTIDSVVNIAMSLTLSNQTVSIGDIVNATVVTTNIGSAHSSPSQVKVTVYSFNGTDLLQEALYSDSLIDYYPGFRREYAVRFAPTEDGIYLVKANMSFASTEFLVWSAFVVCSPCTSPESPSAETPASSGGGGGGGGGAANVTETVVIVQVPAMSLSYPRSLRVEQGDSAVFAIDIANSGTSYLRNLRLFMSSSELLGLDVNPKLIRVVNPSYDYLRSPNGTFLVSVVVPEGVPPGDYALDFKVVSDQLDSSGKVTVTVLPRGALSVDDIRQRILSYGVIISDIERQMLAAGRRGIDVSQVNASLYGAMSDLEEARGLFESGEYGGARDGLDRVRRNLERATLQLATAEFFVYEPAALPWAYIAAAAAVATAAGLYKYSKWRARRRPRLIRDTPQEKPEE